MAHACVHTGWRVAHRAPWSSSLPALVWLFTPIQPLFKNNPCWLPTSQGSKEEKTILKWHSGGLSNGLWQYVWDLWTEVFECCSRCSITEGTHVLHVLTALMTLIVHCCNLFWRNMFWMGQSTIYQDIQIKLNLMKVVFKMQLFFFTDQAGTAPVSHKGELQQTMNQHIYIHSRKLIKKYYFSFSIKYLQSCPCLQRKS